MKYLNLYIKKMHFDYKLFMHNAALNNKKFVLQYVVFVYYNHKCYEEEKICNS